MAIVSWIIAQQKNTFGISDYQPSLSKENKYYFKINGFWASSSDICGGGKNLVKYWLADIKYNYGIASKDTDARYKIDCDDSSIMYRFRIGSGMDDHGHYLSYYDKWDFDKIPVEKNGFFGKPFEIYDRLYYDPVTFEPILSEGFDSSSKQKP